MSFNTLLAIPLISGVLKSERAACFLPSVNEPLSLSYLTGSIVVNPEAEDLSTMILFPAFIAASTSSSGKYLDNVFLFLTNLPSRSNAASLPDSANLKSTRGVGFLASLV